MDSGFSGLRDGRKELHGNIRRSLNSMYELNQTIEREGKELLEFLAEKLDVNVPEME